MLLMGRREEKKARTRQALLDTSIELFRELGFDETRVQDVVGRVGVSPATFFNYFPSKDAVLDAASYRSTQDYIELLRAETAQTQHSAVERLAEVAQLVAAAMDQDPKISALLAARTGFLTGASGELAEADREGQGLVAELFTQGQATGEFHQAHDPHQLAELFTIAMTHTALNHLTGWFGAPTETLTDRVARATQLVLAGAAAPASPSHG